MRRLASLALLAAVAACSRPRDQGGPPWLTMPDLATHSARYFPVTAEDVHGPSPGQPLLTCNQCHADRSSGATPPPPADTFRTFTCTGCHVEIRAGVFHDDIAQLATFSGHAGLPVFDPAQPLAFDQACRSCHPTGFGVPHAQLFPLPHQDVTGATVAACADCHASRTDPTVLGCASCHPHDLPETAAAHALVPDFAASATSAASALCGRCHADSTVPIRVAGHVAFPIGAGPHAAAAGGACLSCHPERRPAPKAFAADFGQPSCTGCHVLTTAGYHDDPTGLASTHLASGVTGFQFTTAACLGCHPDGTAAAPTYHQDLFPVDATSKHAGIACASCHGPDRADLTQLQCASCHADPTKSPSFPTRHDAVGTIAILVALTPPPSSCTPVPYTPSSAECLGCHARGYHFDPINLPTVHPQGDSAFGQDPHRAAGCATCHVVTAQLTATAVPPAPAPSGYPTIDFLTFVSTVTGLPMRPSQGSKGCITCHGYGCGPRGAGN